MKNNNGDRLRNLRVKRGWTLSDVARSLGVTVATISRVERGLQAPPEALLETWELLLEGKPMSARPPRRRPRNALNLLAEMLLADVKAGLNWRSVGWREPTEVRLSDGDLGTISNEIERDSLGRIRISLSSSLEMVTEATNILRYRQTVEAEDKVLNSVLTQRISSLWAALKDETVRGAVIFSGLTKMVKATAPLVLDSCAEFVSEPPICLLSGPAGAALLIVESVGIVVPHSASNTLKGAGLQNLIESPESGEEVEKARRVADQIQLSQIANLIGEKAITALGTAWAYSFLLNTHNATVLTESGLHHVAEVFWQNSGFSREDVIRAWSNITDIESDDELVRTGSLLLAWPEVL